MQTKKRKFWICNDCWWVALISEVCNQTKINYVLQYDLLKSHKQDKRFKKFMIPFLKWWVYPTVLPQCNWSFKRLHTLEHGLILINAKGKVIIYCCPFVAFTCAYIAPVNGLLSRDSYLFRWLKKKVIRCAYHYCIYTAFGRTPKIQRR